jgi:peptidoglycan glycosyltransferase
MNRQINNLFTVFVLLFLLLVAFTSWNAVFGREGLENQQIDGEQVNQRPLLEQQRIPRGIIRANDGTRLAVNRRSGSGQTRVFTRRYPEGSVFAHTVGYSFIEAGDAGLERFYNDELAGQKDEFGSLLDQVLGERKEGEDLRTTLDPAGQRAALAGLQGRRGSVVALEPSTGEVLVMANEPSYNPNGVVEEQERRGRRGASEGSGRFNRATQARYPPGSTMKVVTAAAALDTGKYTPGSLVSGKNNKVISGAPLRNAGGQEFPAIPLTEALTNSVNTVWAEVAVELGPDTMYRYMRRFGFNQKPPVDLPGDELTASGVFNRNSRLLDDEDPVDIGRVGIGQERLQVTPLQMAMVASAVANGGSLMKPHLADRFINPDGRIASRYREDEASQVMSGETAGQLTDMMGQVVREGTGTQAALEGIDVAGKTGSAEVENATNIQAWFIGFAPKDDPKVAIAVTVERAGAAGTGGETAAPIAKQVMQALIGREASG